MSSRRITRHAYPSERSIACKSREQASWCGLEPLEPRMLLTASLTYSAADLGGGLTAYTFELSCDDGLGAAAVAVGFRGVNGATIQQVLYNGAGNVDTEAQATTFDGTGNPPYDKETDTWVFAPWYDNALPGLNPFEGGVFSGIVNGDNVFLLSAGSGGGSQVGDGTDVAYVVANGNVEWDGTVSRDQDYDTSGIATPAGGDTTAPVVTVSNIGLTNDTRPDFSGTIDDDEAAITVTVGEVTYTEATGVMHSTAGNTWTLPGTALDAPLSDGVYDITVTATDPSSNVGTDDTTNELTVDGTAPVITVDSVGLTNDATPDLGGTIDDDSAAVAVTIGGTTYTEATGVVHNTTANTWSLAGTSLNGPLAEGTHNVNATASDAAGNVGTDGSIGEVMVDTTPPTATVTPQTTNDTTPDISGTIDDDDASLVVVVDGQTYNNEDVVRDTDNKTWTLPGEALVAALAEGTHDVSVTATDGAGNAGSDATADELVIDTTVLTVTVTPKQTADNTPSLSGTVSDAAATVEIAVGGQTHAASVNGNSWMLADNVLTALADGTYNVVATATLGEQQVQDATGNELLVDTTAPLVTVDAQETEDTTPDITGTIDDDAATLSVVVNGQTYTGDDIVRNAAADTWTLPGAALAAALLPDTYDVEVTATDALGNVGQDGSTDELVIQAAGPVTSVVTLGDELKSLVYTDPDGRVVTVKAGKGQVRIMLRSDAAVLQFEDGRGVELISVSGCVIDAIEVLAASKGLKFTASADGATLEDITGGAELSKLDAKTMDLVGGGIDMDGAISKLSLRNIQADVLMAGATKGVAISAEMDIAGADIVLSGSDLKSLKTGRLVDASVFVGISVAPDGTLPTDDDLQGGFELKKLTVAGYDGLLGPAFANAFVAAESIRSASLTDMEFDNGGEDFGFTTKNPKIKVKLNQDGDRYVFGKRWVNDDGDFEIV